MTTSVQDERDRRPIAPIILSGLLGLGAAVLASFAIVSANASNDGDAVNNGPTELLDPAAVLNYGG